MNLYTDLGLNSDDQRKTFIENIDKFLATLACVINEDLYERAIGRYMTTAERFGLTFNDQIRSYSDRKKFFDSYKEAIYALVCRFKTYPIPKSVREAPFAAQWSKSARDWIMREDFDSSEEENEPSTSKGSAPKENVE